MRIRVTWPDGNERRGTIRTWRELYSLVARDDRDRRLVAVEPEDDGFHVTVLPE